MCQFASSWLFYCLCLQSPEIMSLLVGFYTAQISYSWIASLQRIRPTHKYAIMPVILHVCSGFNSGPHARSASTLAAEPSLWPWRSGFLWGNWQADDNFVTWVSSRHFLWSDQTELPLRKHWWYCCQRENSSFQVKVPVLQNFYLPQRLTVPQYCNGLNEKCPS